MVPSDKRIEIPAKADEKHPIIQQRLQSSTLFST
jgi:hypothetical protein